MDILAQLAALAALIGDLKGKLEDTQKALDEATKAAYDKGFAAGVASVIVPPPSDKIFSQKEADDLVAAAVEPLQKKVAELEALVAGIDQKVADGVALVKADLLAKYKELEVAAQALETGFEDLLK